MWGAAPPAWPRGSAEVPERRGERAWAAGESAPARPRVSLCLSRSPASLSRRSSALAPGPGGELLNKSCLPESGEKKGGGGETLLWWPGVLPFKSAFLRGGKGKTPFWLSYFLAVILLSSCASDDPGSIFLCRQVVG